MNLLKALPPLMLSILLVPAASVAKPKTDEAVSAAKAWLKAVDSKKYDQSWDEAAKFFQGAVPKKTWVDQLNGVRTPLGPVIKRELKKATPHTSLPGAPDGEYVVMIFKASFKNKKSAVETITAMKQKDGNWRIAGYFIK